ncbi:MAG TPA: hypothetical protein ENH11_04365 [Candidatus Acetothermia bacterium]|nr:hypothetical protein [Candidatus Acetothermia bacterium]
MPKLLIELSEPEVRATLTHYKVAAYRFEVARAELEKPGFVQIWLAKSYKDADGLWLEPFSEGVEILIDDPVKYDDFMAMTIAAGPLGTSVGMAIHQWLVDNGYLDGTVVIVP